MNVEKRHIFTDDDDGNETEGTNGTGGEEDRGLMGNHRRHLSPPSEANIVTVDT